MSLHNKFYFRAFVSLLATFSFLILGTTGVVLYITPPGRIANWTTWTFWGLTKHQWTGLHICFSTLFVIISVIHIWLNFKPLVNYLVGKAQLALKFRIEWLIAIAVCGIVFAGALKPFIPFSSLLDLNQRLKFSWESPADKPPIPHAELLTIAELADQADMEPDAVLSNLKEKDILASENDIFGAIAEENGLSPNELFSIATGTGTPPATRGFGNRGGGRAGQQGGFGQQTLRQVCAAMGIDESAALEALKQAGIKASGEKTIRQIADENGVHPSQIRQVLENQ